MKTITDPKQSKSLREVLRLKTADYTWTRVGMKDGEVKYREDSIPFFLYSGIGLPAWSLANLIELLPVTITTREGLVCYLEFTKNTVSYYDSKKNVVISSVGDCLLDACVKIIVELGEQGLI